jgi:hypothetical protein
MFPSSQKQTIKETFPPFILKDLHDDNQCLKTTTYDNFVANEDGWKLPDFIFLTATKSSCFAEMLNALSQYGIRCCFRIKFD